MGEFQDRIKRAVVSFCYGQSQHDNALLKEGADSFRVIASEIAKAADARIAELESRVERLRADADRYQWLRNESWSLTHDSKKYPRVAETVVITDPYMRVTLLAEDALDAAIDEARKGGGDGNR